MSMTVRQLTRKLDKRQPNWYRKINPETLDLHSNRYCVLGQVYGDYQWAPSKLRVTIWAFGFLRSRYKPEWAALVKHRQIKDRGGYIKNLDLRRKPKTVRPLFVPDAWTVEQPPTTGRYKVLA